MSRWFVAQTHPHAEDKAEQNLRRQGFLVYLPRYLKRRRHARQTQLVRAPLFPRYLFVQFDPAVTRWRAIASTIGVSRLVCAGEDRPLPVPEGVVEDIQARADDKGLVALPEPPPFQRGEAVRVTSGPLAELVGLFEGMSDSDRVMVLLDLLGRRIRIGLPRDSVAAWT